MAAYGRAKELLDAVVAGPEVQTQWREDLKCVEDAIRGLEKVTAP